MNLWPTIHNKRRLIAGPCALESRSQLRSSLQLLNSYRIPIFRACLWKPRTKPGWDGIGYYGISMLLEETLQLGMIPATEIIIAKHAECIVQSMKAFDSQAKMMLWIGARNQNHFELAEMARVLASGPDGIYLMFKNQMWDDESHWLGIAEHLIAHGFPKERLLTCHRGFAPGKMPNPHNLRNIPDFEMAMRVKQELDMPIIFDPSHTGGSPEKIVKMMNQSLHYDFNGFIIEVHSDPEHAKTDSKQQLNHEQFEQILHMIEEASQPVLADAAKSL